MRFRLPLTLVLVLASSGSCGSTITELVVVVETNLSVPSELDAVDIIVIGASSRSTVSESLVGDGAPTFPLTLGVTPGGESLDVEVVAVGTLDAAEVVRTSARVTLIPGESRTLHLVLLRGCAGRACAADEACGPGGCAPAQRADLPPWNGSPPVYVEEDPCDSALWDADDDGVGSLACGGADCDDANETVGPDAVEACDGIDNDCDGEDDPASCSCTVNGMVQSCTTVCGSTGEQTCMDGSFGTCDVLPETCNGVDDDCNGVTDEGFDYVALGEARLTEDDSDSGPPRLRFVDDRWALVWADRLGSDEQGIYFSSLDAAAASAVAPTRVASQGHSPDFAWSGSVFGVAWIRRQSRMDCCDLSCAAMCTFNDDRVNALVFDSSGTPLSALERLDPNVDQFPTTRVEWDGTSFLASFRDGEPELARFDDSGVELADDIDIAVDGDDADFLWSGTHYAAVFTFADVVIFKHDPTTAFVLPEVQIADPVRPRSAALDDTASGYLVGWFHEQEAGQIGIEVMTVDADATPGGTSVSLSQTVGGAGFPEDYPRTPTIRAAPGQVLVTWADQRDGNLEVYFARVSEAGEVIQAATRLTTSDGLSDGTAAAWSGEEFGVAWADERDGNSEIYFNRLGCPP